MTPKLSTAQTNGIANAARIAQSQPGSRSTSPTPMSNYLTHKNDVTLNGTLVSNNGSVTNGGYNSTPKSKMTFNSSRNSSRESSPGRRSSMHFVAFF